MVERPPTLNRPKDPAGSGRPRPTRGQLAARRVVGLIVVVGGLAIVVWLGVIGLRALRNDDTPPPATTAVAAPPKPFRIIFPEGFTRRQMAERVTAVARIAEDERHTRVRLSAQTYLAATAKPRSITGFGARRYPLEGFLFPATYDFTKHTTSKRLMVAQLKAFRRNWKHVDLRYARSKNLTPYDVLTIASMVEKETVAPDERPLVAAVIYNRLHARMTLGIDATLRYGLDIPPTESIRQSQLESDSPYNTRKFAGLPPTPIANPGLASIQAAAHPARVDYLYFVRKPDKVHHFFTASEREFINYKNAHGY